ncbi:LOG family protein [Candidatus Woesearchaeota archaeon]|nr:LOG family protein [Candidatus Woesearchaeota archaeon]
MNIGVCGSAVGPDHSIRQKAREIGHLLAQQGHTLVCGGTTGYPDEALKGALEGNGKSICFSPAKDKPGHIQVYHFPFYPSSEYVFTGKGIPGRNQSIIEASDSVIIIGGQIGTLNEFTLAFVMKKPIFIFKDSGGVVRLLPQIIEVCKKGGEQIVTFGNLEELRQAISNQ